MAQNKNTVGHIVSFFTIIIWGTTFISTKFLLKDFTPIEILFFRFILGFFTLSLVYPHKLHIKDRKQEWLFIGAGLCGVTLYFLFENIALMLSYASNVGVIVSIAPFFTAILAHLFLENEKMKPAFFLGFAASIAGIFLISFNGSTILKLNPMGDLLAVLAAAVWAVYSILTKKISAFHYNTIQTTRRIFFYGIVFMIPALFLFDFQLDLLRFTKPINLLNMLYLGFGASALCFVTWNWAVKILGAVKTSVYIYIIPVITVTISAIVLHERITWIAITGTALIMVGLFLSTYSKVVKEVVSSQADIL